MTGFVAMRRGLSTRLAALLVRVFREFTSWSDGDAEAFAAQAVPLAEGARQTMANLTSAWIAQQAGQRTGLAVPVAPVPDLVLARPGITTAEVYSRPFVTVRAQLAGGKSVPEAVDVAAHRLETITEGDMQRAHSQAASSAIEQLPDEAKPLGWRRVLQGRTNCPMCVLASTQLFDNGALNPAHPRCDCTVALAYDNPHPIEERGRRDVQDALLALGADPTGMDDRQYRALLRVMTKMHGELGPMLVRPGQHFTGPADLPS